MNSWDHYHVTIRFSIKFANDGEQNVANKFKR